MNRSLNIGLFLIAAVCGTVVEAKASPAPASSAPFADLTRGEAWKATIVPFSFTYGGKDSRQFLTGWQETETDTSSHEHRYSFTDPTTHLIATAQVRTFADFPAVDWVITFRNAGTIDTPILENVRALSWIASPGGDTVIHHAKGSNAEAQDFMPLDDTLNASTPRHYEPLNGRSSDTTTLPFFNLQCGDHGMIIAIGWSGTWQADFQQLDSSAHSGKFPFIQVSAGMKNMHLLLHPGEEIRTPRIVVMNWSGGDWLAAQNTWRRLLLAHYSPHDNGKPMLGPVLTGTWGAESPDPKIALMKWVSDNKIPLGVLAVDAGWYGHTEGGENDAKNPWWNCRGDWWVDPLYYPHGIRPLGEACKDASVGFSLWVEPETAMPNTKIVNDHPDWFLHTDHPVNPGVMLANYAIPAARRGITAMISGFITEFEMTWYRQDFNINPDVYWAKADAPDRVGMTEIGHVEGLYQLWDDLRREHPGLHIDNCASGGRRLDLELMSRSFCVWRTDHGDRDTLSEQAQTQALAPWVPLTEAYEMYTTTQPWTQPAPHDTPEHVYLMRLGYNAGYGLEGGIGTAQTQNPDWVAFLNHAINEYRDVQPYFYGDFYALQPYSLSDDAWSAWQWDRPEKNDGLIVLLRRPKSTAASLTLNLHRIDPTARYNVEICTGFEKPPWQQMKGSELAHLAVSLPQAPSSELIFYRHAPTSRD